MLCVNYVTLGSCARGHECRYAHVRPKNDEEERYYKELHKRIVSRSASPAPKGKGKGICKMWTESKSCKFGDKCRYAHIDGAATPVVSGKGGRKRSKSRDTKGTPAVPASGASGATGSLGPKSDS